MGVAIAFLLLAGASQPPQPPPAGEILLRRACTTCHPLDVIHARRLPREDWGLELNKMAAMGAQIRNRKALLDYLASTYGSKE